MADGYELRIAATANDLSTVRIFARSVARSLDLDEGPAEDLELLASELCAEMIEAGATSVEIRVDALPEALALTLAGDGAVIDTTGASDRRDLLGSLAPGLRWNPAGADCVMPRGVDVAHEA